MPYVAVQSASDSLVPDGGRYYFKSHFMDELTDDAIAAMTTCDATRPNNESLIIRTLGGAIDRVTAADSAYPHRGAQFNVSIDGVWSDPAHDAATIGWVRHTWDTMRRFANGGVYLNFAGLEDEADIATGALLGPNGARLEKIRADYDPDGLFSQAAARP